MKKTRTINRNDRTKATTSKQGILGRDWLPEAMQAGFTNTFLSMAASSQPMNSK
jgi:hypothetical protein